MSENREALPRQSAARIEVTVHVCPVCLTVGPKDHGCSHYESGSVGWVYYKRRPATLTVTVEGWEPVTDSLDSKAAA